MNFNFISKDHSDYIEARKIRIECFFQGYENAEELLDDQYEKYAKHLIAYSYEGKIMGTGRMNLENETSTISQMAIKSFYQRKGIGSQILDRLLVEAQKEGVKEVVLSARVSALSFYQKYGFVVIGEKYPSIKTGILHQKMVYNTNLTIKSNIGY